METTKVDGHHSAQSKPLQLPIFASIIGASLVIALLFTGVINTQSSPQPQNPQSNINANQFIRQFQDGKLNNSQIEDTIHTIEKVNYYYFVYWNVTFKSAKNTVFVSYDDELDNLSPGDRVSCYVYATTIGSNVIYTANGFEKID